MAFRTVGAVGIKVRPDTTKFHEELQSKLRAERDVHVEIPVEPSKDVSKTRLEDWARAATRKAEEAAIRVRIAATLGADTLLRDVKTRTDIINEKIKARPDIRVRIPAVVDDRGLAGSVTEVIKEAQRQAKTKGPVELPLTLDFDEEKAKKKLDRFIDEESGKNVELKIDVDHKGLAAAQLAFLARDRDVNLRVRIEKRAYAIAVGALQGLTGLNVLKESGRLLEDLAKHADEFALSVGKIGIAFGNLVNLAGVGIGGLASVAGDIGKIGGAALALPAAAASITTFVVVGIAAFKNFHKALRGNADALAALPADARDAVESLRGVWTSIQIPVQSTFWSQVGNSFQDTMNDVVDDFRDGMVHVSGSMGQFFKAALEGIDSFAGSGVFRGMFANLSQGISIASQGITPLTQALITLGDQGSKFLPVVGEWLAKNLNLFNQWIQVNSANGNIAKWMEDAATQAHNLKEAVKNFGGILSGIARAARSADVGGLENLAEKLGDIRDVVEGPAFQDTLSTLFDGAKKGAENLGKALGPLGSAIKDLAPTLSEILASVGTTLGDFVSAVADATHSPIFKNGLSGLFTGLQSGVEGFDSHMQSIVDGIGSLGSLTGTVFSGVLPVIGQFFGDMADVMVRLQRPLQDVATALSGSLSRGVTLLGQAASLATGPVSTLLELFSNLPNVAQDALLSVGFIHKLTGGLSLKDSFKGFGGIFTGLGTAASQAGQNAARAVRVSLISEMNKVSPAIRQAMDKDYFGTFFRGIGSSISQTVASATQRLAVFRTAIGDGLVRAGRSFTTFLGGPWGVALLGATTFLSIMADGAQRLQRNLDDAKAAAENLANIKLANPTNPTDNLDAQNAALEQAQKVIDAAKVVGVDLSGRKQGIINVLLGKPDPDALKALQELQKTAEDQASSGFSRDVERLFSFGSQHAGTDWADLNTKLQGVLNTAPKVAEIVNDKLGQTGQVIDTNMKTAADAVENFGVITLKNVPRIVHSLSAAGPEVKGVTTPFQDMAEIMSEAIGGSGKVVEDNATKIADGLSTVGDSAQEIARFMSSDGFDTRQISKALQVLGYGTDQISDAIANRFVPAIALVPKGFQGYENGINGIFDSIPHLTKASDGIKEVAQAVGQAANVDPSKLENIFHTFGTSAQDVVRGLSSEGFGSDTIKAVLRGMGIDGYQAGSAMMFLADQAKQALGPHSMDPQKVQDFATALQQIADSAGNAAAQAGAFRDALDRLNGGQVDSMRIESDFQAALDNVESQLKAVGSDGKLSFDWSKVFKNGQLNFELEQNRTLFSNLDSLATNALARASDAYSKTFAKTGDYTKAQQAANQAVKDSLGPMEEQFAKNTKNKTAVDDLFESLGLLPAEVVTNAIVNSRGATEPLVRILGLLNDPAMAGKTIPVGALTADAVKKLSDLGVQVTQLSDGTWAVTVSGDTSVAKSQVDGLQTYINSKSYTASVSLDVDLGPLYNLPRSVGSFTGYFTPVAMGGIFEKVLRPVKAFANGGIENHTAHITRTMRIFGEPETGGEAYIPLSPSKRGRSVAILADVAHRFGYTIERLDTKLRRFASGGAAIDQTYVQGGSTFNITNINPVAEPTSKSITEAARHLVSYGV